LVGVLVYYLVCPRISSSSYLLILEDLAPAEMPKSVGIFIVHKTPLEFIWDQLVFLALCFNNDPLKGREVLYLHRLPCVVGDIRLAWW